MHFNNYVHLHFSPISQEVHHDFISFLEYCFLFFQELTIAFFTFHLLGGFCAFYSFFGKCNNTPVTHIFNTTFQMFMPIRYSFCFFRDAVPAEAAHSLSPWTCSPWDPSGCASVSCDLLIPRSHFFHFLELCPCSGKVNLPEILAKIRCTGGRILQLLYA